MSRPLVIVESPAKAKTIAGFLGNDFAVESSIGHIRDLPRNAADIPVSVKGEPWARLGVNVDDDFKPLYIIPKEKMPQVKKLKSLLKDASEVFLATDEDREGESIAWHLMEVLSPKVPVRRMVFHEITQNAIQSAIGNSRDLDRKLVDAQEARRILDRLYGYEVSPVLWKKVMPGLSAGRVQSVATRIIVERERSRMAFTSGQWWDLEATLASQGQTFKANSVEIDSKRIATGKDFLPTGELKNPQEVVWLNEEQAQDLASRLQDSIFEVASVEEKPFTRSPYPPFMTSTLQQEAGRKLHFSSQRTMQIAQRLYENGFITYMRTDSTNLSDQALQAARSQAKQLYGPEYIPEKPRTYNKKVKNAQEAHEAIRPAGETFRTPKEIVNLVSLDEARLYELIWKRTIASQMKNAKGHSLQVSLIANSSGEKQEVKFVTSGKTLEFFGFLKAYVEGVDDPNTESEDSEIRLPKLEVGQKLSCTLGQDCVLARSHNTQPPPRFTEASLVKALEDLGVGRPSTYASIIATIQNRGYVWKKGTALVPSFTAFAVINLLEDYFSKLVDYSFTATMEDDLDDIASGTKQAIPWLNSFYFGNADPGLKEMVSTQLGEIDAREINSIPIGNDENSVPILIRVGRYGPYIQRGEDRAAIPEDLCPDELDVNKALELLSIPTGDKELGKDPQTGLDVVVKSGRYGPYVQLGETGDPGYKTASLFKTMSVESIDLDQALQLLTLPRSLGIDPNDNKEIIASNGRFGPYIKKANDTRSLNSEDELLTIDLDQAIEIFSQPKKTRARKSAEPLKNLGKDPSGDKEIVVKEGRFGPYVTDGEINASFRKGDTIQDMTNQRAAELLAEKRLKDAASPPKAKKRSKTKIKS